MKRPTKVKQLEYKILELEQLNNRILAENKALKEQLEKIKGSRDERQLQVIMSLTQQSASIFEGITKCLLSINRDL